MGAAAGESPVLRPVSGDDRRAAEMGLTPAPDRYPNSRRQIVGESAHRESLTLPQALFLRSHSDVRDLKLREVPVVPETPRIAHHWHTLNREEAVALLYTDPGQGLSGDEATRSLARFGPNALPEPARRSVLAIFLRQFKKPLFHPLLAASAIAVAVSHRTDAAVILAAVVANALIGVIQEGRAPSVLAALRRLARHKAPVLRGGREEVIEARDVVPGDVILLDAGDAVTADARLIHGAALQIAERSPKAR